MLHARIFDHPVFTVLLIGCLALAGCDSGGSDAPDPETFTVEIENVGAAAPILKSGAFTTPVGASGAAPIVDGESYEITFTAGPNEIPNSGMKLSLATMFIQSNDLYYAFGPGGLSLFNDDGTPIGQNGAVDVTDQIGLYDAGTEGDQEPGVGLDQAPRQSGLNTGPSGEGTIARVEGEDGGFRYPAASDIIRVTITPPSTSQ